MKTNRKLDNEVNSAYQFTYNDHPSDGEKNARIDEWENGEGCDVYLGEDKIELSYQEITVLEILFAQVRLIK